MIKVKKGGGAFLSLRKGGTFKVKKWGGVYLWLTE